MIYVTYSKKIIFASYIISTVLTVILIVGTFLGFDMSNLTQIALVSWGEVAVSNAFYFKKAEKENVIKIANSLPKEAKEQVDYNQILNNE